VLEVSTLAKKLGEIRARAPKVDSFTLNTAFAQGSPPSLGGTLNPRQGRAHQHLIWEPLFKELGASHAHLPLSRAGEAATYTYHPNYAIDWEDCQIKKHGPRTEVPVPCNLWGFPHRNYTTRVALCQVSARRRAAPPSPSPSKLARRGGEQPTAHFVGCGLSEAVAELMILSLAPPNARYNNRQLGKNLAHAATWPSSRGARSPRVILGLLDIFCRF
jgi:hypothetical protein